MVSSGEAGLLYCSISINLVKFNELIKKSAMDREIHDSTKDFANDNLCGRPVDELKFRCAKNVYNKLFFRQGVSLTFLCEKTIGLSRRISKEYMGRGLNMKCFRKLPLYSRIFGLATFIVRQKV